MEKKRKKPGKYKDNLILQLHPKVITPNHFHQYMKKIKG